MLLEIFYNENCQIVRSNGSSIPNPRGITTHSYELGEVICCSIKPISNYYAKQTYGVDSQATLEVTVDGQSVNPKEVYAIIVRGEMYIVENYKIIPQFMILEEQITFAVRCD